MPVTGQRTCNFISVSISKLLVLNPVFVYVGACVHYHVTMCLIHKFGETLLLLITKVLNVLVKFAQEQIKI